MAKTRAEKLEELRIESQLLVISLTKLKDAALDAGIPIETIETLNDATCKMELFRREVAAERLVERGILSGDTVDRGEV